MPKYRKRWRPDGTSYEVVDDSGLPARQESFTYMPDCPEFVSYAGPKPEVITGRKKLREHCRGLNIRPCGDLKNGEMFRKEVERRNEATRGAVGEMVWY